MYIIYYYCYYKIPASLFSLLFFLVFTHHLFIHHAVQVCDLCTTFAQPIKLKGIENLHSPCFSFSFHSKIGSSALTKIYYQYMLHFNFMVTLLLLRLRLTQIANCQSLPHKHSSPVMCYIISKANKRLQFKSTANTVQNNY